jgi:hypothetical protein
VRHSRGIPQARAAGGTSHADMEMEMMSPPGAHLAQPGAVAVLGRRRDGIAEEFAPRDQPLRVAVAGMAGRQGDHRCPRLQRIVANDPHVGRLHDALLHVGVDPLPPLPIDDVDRVARFEDVEGPEGRPVGRSVAGDGEVPLTAWPVRLGVVARTAAQRAQIDAFHDVEGVVADDRLAVTLDHSTA